jgi:methylmalonyl-CoA/ethylmalonyl-CoA epimerase
LTLDGGCGSDRVVFQVTDLKTVTVATPDLDGAVATFRRNFGFPIIRSLESAENKTRSTCLGIGAAEIEIMTPAAEGSPLAGFLAERGPGLYLLVLEVDDLEAARADLAERGIEVSLKKSPDGRSTALLSSTQTHGVRIALVERSGS